MLGHDSKGKGSMLGNANLRMFTTEKQEMRAMAAALKHPNLSPSICGHTVVVLAWLHELRAA